MNGGIVSMNRFIIKQALHPARPVPFGTGSHPASAGGGALRS
jgi:hypothetical protein